jgi:hypothetical protein
MVCALFCNVLKISGVADTFCACRECIWDVFGAGREIAQGGKRTNPGERGALRRPEPGERTIRTGDERTFRRIAQVPINVKCGTSIRNDIYGQKWRVASGERLTRRDSGDSPRFAAAGRRSQGKRSEASLPAGRRAPSPTRKVRRITGRLTFGWIPDVRLALTGGMDSTARSARHMSGDPCGLNRSVQHYLIG